MNLFGLSISRRVTTKQVIAATVRPQDAALAISQAAPMTMEQACNRYAKWVKIAISRNAVGLGSCPMRVYRATNKVERSAFKTRRLDARRLDWLHQAGGVATRSIDDYGDAEEITDETHPLVALIRKPSPIETQLNWVENTETFQALAGNAYTVKVRGNEGYPIEMWQLPPMYVRVHPNPAGLVSHYTYGRGREVEQRWDAEDVIQFRRPNPHASRLTPWPYYGLGDLAACVEDADMVTLMTRFGLAMLMNGGQPGIIARPPKDAPFLSEQQAEAVQTALNRKFGGVEKAGKAVVLTGAIEIEKMSLGEKEVAFLSSQTASMEVIANAFDVPVSLMRLDTAGAVATTASAIVVWQRMGLRPKAKRIEDTLNERLVEDFRVALSDPGLFVCFDNIVDKDFAVDSVASSTLYNGGIVTKNEARAIVGFDAVDDGDDFKEIPEPMGLGGYGGEGGKEGEGKEDKEPSKDEGRTVVVARSRDERDGRLPNRSDLRNCSDLVRWSDLLWGSSVCCENHCRNIGEPIDGEDELSAQRLYQAVRQWFARVERGVQFNGDIASIKVNTATLRKALEEMTEPEIMRLFGKGWDKAGVHVDVFSIENKPAIDFLRRYQFKLSNSVAGTTEERLRAAVTKTIQEGGSIADGTKAIQEAVEGMSASSAERIARTETARAFVTGRENAWMKSGQVKAKRWSLSSDPCPLCQAMADQFNARDIPLGAPFVAQGGTITGSDGLVYLMDYADVNGPPIHPSCRCDLEAVFRE